MQRRYFSKIFVGAMMLPSINMAAASPKLRKIPKKIIKPTRLASGDVIGLIAPGSGMSAEAFEKAVTHIESLGFKTRYTATARLENGYLSADEWQRAADLHRAFSDPEVKAVWCVRGGYGCARLLPFIDFSIIKKNPKIFIGFSDITAVHLAILGITGLVTFHGPVGISEFNPYTQSHILELLMHPQPTFTFSPATTQGTENMADPVYAFKTLVKGQCEGRLIGGNLTLLTSLAGTPWAPDLSNTLLFLEDIDERPYKLDRMYTQMIESNNLNLVNGFALGIYPGCVPKEGELSMNMEEMHLDRLGNFRKPIGYGFSIGHVPNQCTLPLGINARMDADNGSITLLEPAVI